MSCPATLCAWSGWSGSRGRCSLLAVLFILAPASVEGQRVAAGAHYAFAEYAEQGASLRFGGGGPSGHVSLGWGRFDLQASMTKLAFEPRDEASVAEPFDATQTDIRLRARVTRLVSVEAGYFQRDVEPLHAAQSVAAMRLGALVSFPLTVGSEVAVRAGYLGGSKFSGGGSAPFGLEIGLGVDYAPRWERLRLMGDIEFQRMDRRTSTADGRLAAPIQSSLARIGVRFSY